MTQKHDANGPPRLQAQLLDQRHGLKRGHDSAAVVIRALADVPGIDVASQHHHFFRLLAPANLAHHVMRIGVGLLVRFHHQPHAHRRSAAHQPFDHGGIFDAQGRRGNLRHAVGVVQRSGVRGLQTVVGHRPDQHRDRAEFRRTRCTGGPVLHRLSVALPFRD